MNEHGIRTAPIVDTETLADSFDDAAGRFDEALRSGAGLLAEYHCRIADQSVCLRILGPVLAQEIMLPFLHLEAQADPVEMHIDVWHEAECGTTPMRLDRPPLPGPYGVMVASEDGRFVAEHRAHSATWLDRQARRIVAWVSSHKQLHLDERARPFHRMVAISMGDHGIQFAHAGLVASEGHGVLLVGKGGSGKSTTSLTCLIEGMDYLGDDFVGIAFDPDRGHTGHSLFGSAVIGLGHMQHYPALAAASRPGNHVHEEKSLVDLGRLGDVSLVASTKIRAIVLPRVAAQVHTSFSGASARDALVALAPSSMLLVPGSGTRALGRLSALVRDLPSYWLNLGSDLRQIEPQVRRLLAEAGRGS